MQSNKKKKTEAILKIDGQFGEGGGQIIRNSIAYACLFQRSIEVFNIRANRPKPGLASQHLESMLALKRITGFKTNTYLEKGITEFDLNATSVSSDVQAQNVHTIDLKTAGSISLCIQSLLPYFLSLKTLQRIKIIGGTHVLKAPSFDFLSRVFVPMVNHHLGFKIKVEMQRPGYFPRGGGIVNLTVDCSPDGFKNFEIVGPRGKLIKSTAILNCPRDWSQNDISELKSRLNKAGFCSTSTSTTTATTTNDSNLNNENIGLLEIRSVPYASLEVLLQFENNIYAGFSDIAEGRRPSAADLLAKIETVLKSYDEFMKSDANVDSFMADQLILYMGLARYFANHNQNQEEVRKSSRIKTVQLTDHSTSAIHIAQLFLNSESESSAGSGPGLENTTAIFDIENAGDNSFIVKI